MTISSIVNTRQTTGNKVNCNARVTVVRSRDGAALPGVTVSAQWGALPTRAGWPYDATPVTATTNVAAFRSSNLPATRGNGCTFVVTGVTLAGYQLDPNSPTVGPTVSW
jgi:hypothetical protein